MLICTHSHWLPSGPESDCCRWPETAKCKCGIHLWNIYRRGVLDWTKLSDSRQRTKQDIKSSNPFTIGDNPAMAITVLDGASIIGLEIVQEVHAVLLWAC